MQAWRQDPLKNFNGAPSGALLIFFFCRQRKKKFLIHWDGWAQNNCLFPQILTFEITVNSWGTSINDIEHVGV
jgi:hypothetical protein